MLQIEEKDGTFNFVIKGELYEVFFANDGFIEIYEINNPAETGFIFDDKKNLILFINALTDIISRKQEEEKYNESISTI